MKGYAGMLGPLGLCGARYRSYHATDVVTPATITATMTISGRLFSFRLERSLIPEFTLFATYSWVKRTPVRHFPNDEPYHPTTAASAASSRAASPGTKLLKYVTAPTAACSATPLHTVQVVLAHSYTGVNCDHCQLTAKSEGVVQTEGVTMVTGGTAQREVVSKGVQGKISASMVTQK